MAENETLNEITDPVARSKLAGIQESVFSVDAEIERVKASLEGKRGMLAAFQLGATRVYDRCGRIHKAVEEGKMDPERGKARVAEVEAASKILRDLAAEQHNDLVNLRGQIDGMERSVQVIGGRFKAEAAKFERWQEEALDKPDGGDDEADPFEPLKPPTEAEPEDEAATQPAQ